VEFEKASCIEGVKALALSGGAEAGRWFPKDGSKLRDVNEP
jgi:hypothetical protein